MTALIIEDEQPAARRLARLLADADSTILIGPVLESVTEAVTYLQTSAHPDLLFSDIQLSDGLSFEVFRQVEPRCPIIFTTAYDEYAVQAFKLNSLDYLLKPIVPRELEAALTKFRKTIGPAAPSALDYGQLVQALNQSQRTYRQRFLVSYRDMYRAIPTREVAYFYSENKITRLVCPDNKWFPIPETLEELVDQLDPRLFFRASRQCIVGIESITAIHKHFNGRLKLDLTPSAPEEVFISRDRAEALKVWLNQ
ncbi:LytR/AlgR family response regulator transcription factor [Spirosoma sordidisoli]|uniref:Response regulator transcription factor n=1 Tax=Spirosoma sordidisoli TaxID=2502893 RepID=A0A4Q2URF9_9BACT|nr:LytTR family DNA-binding domain-containing protein [Spirosoma sordidisoli]RYC69409.1 response regulator transcription factor [Spirosoma sordidisoli]